MYVLEIKVRSISISLCNRFLCTSFACLFKATSKGIMKPNNFCNEVIMWADKISQTQSLLAPTFIKSSITIGPYYDCTRSVSQILALIRNSVILRRKQEYISTSAFV